MKIYLDNAASTQPDPEVIEAMMPYLRDHFGNPSSTHSFGREAKSALELSRKKMADLLGCSPSEIIFTSGGTEADNTALTGFVETYGIKTIITSPLEHHAVIHTLEHLQKTKGIHVMMLDIDGKGNYALDQLEENLKSNPMALVCLMHGNNEIGNLADLQTIAGLCKEYKARFHSDTVQTFGKIPINARTSGIDCIAGSAHKFHGPKGVGFMVIKSTSKISPFLHGGGQERNMRSGTENVAGVVGLARALEIATSSMAGNEKYIIGLKKHMIERLGSELPGLQYNGNSADLSKSLYTILNISLPPDDKLDLLLFQLDLKNIAASGGSACASGALTGSHVLNAIHSDPQRPAIRFSFSKFNTLVEIDFVADTLVAITRRN